jgi:hypothetical protein
MPAKRMSLQISNGNHYSGMFQSHNPSQSQSVVPPKNVSLNSSMIQRIHNIRPGCGSCGK